VSRAAAELLARLLPGLVDLLGLGAWEVLVRVYAIPSYVLPGPLRIVDTLWQEAPDLLAALAATLQVALAALATATIVGVLLAVLLVQSRLLERSVYPWLVTLQVTPVVSIAPLILIWADDVFAALLICATIVAFFPIVANSVHGLRSVDPGLAQLFRLYGASRSRTLVHLQLPTALPAFLAGMRIAGGLSLVGAVVAEFVAGTGGTSSGLASRILESGYRLEIPRMFAALLLLAVAGILLHAALDLLTRALLRHRPEARDA
jgi:NitT/TauT family transport system permease protein